MIIFWYLSRRFISYFLAISCFLAFLFNFVEFFEKMMRVKHTNVLTILQFLGLNFLPATIQLMPMGLWLATCMLLKEIFSRNEWETLQLLAFVPKRFFTFALLMGLTACATVLLVRETFVDRLTVQSERFRQEKFKQAVCSKLVSRWTTLGHDQFGYFSVLDLEKNEGIDLLVVTMSQASKLKNVLMAPLFTIDPGNDNIFVFDAKVVEMDDMEELVHPKLMLHSPSFFSQLRTNFEVPTLTNLVKKIVVHGSMLPIGVYHELLTDFFIRLGYFLQLLLYPLFTFCLFVCVYHTKYLRWALALLPYPLFVCLGGLMDGIAHVGMNPALTLLPYLGAVLFIAGCRFLWR